MKHFSINTADIDHFPDGEKIIRVDESTLGQEEVLIKYRWDWSTYQCLVGATRKLQNSGSKVSLYLPYMFGARSDRAFGPRECNYFRDVMAPAINSLGFKSVYTIDPHSYVVEGCIPNLIAGSNEFLVKKVTKKLRDATGKKLCLIIPDEGAGKKAAKLLSYFDIDVQFYKQRGSKGEVTRVYAPDEALKSSGIKDATQDYLYVVVDDICDGGATFLSLAKALNKSLTGYDAPVTLPMTLIVTHGIFSKGTDALLRSYKRIYTTNSIVDKIDLNVEVENVWSLHDYGEQIFK